MMAVIHLLFLALRILSAEGARQRAPTTRQGVHWLQQSRSVLVGLETPDLPLWNPEERIGENVPTALLFNFTLTFDSRTLLLNGIPILPLTNAYVPPQLYAPQMAATSLNESENRTFDFHSAPSFGLDYYREGPVPEHPSARYKIYNPKLTLDILGAGIEGYNTLLLDDNMRMISIYLKELQPYSKYPFTPISSRRFEIADVLMEDRFPSHYPLTTPDQLKECTLWSWRCSEFGMQYPWYKYVYRQAFDEYGKIGSFRHMILQRWGTMFKRLGLWRSVIMLVVLTGMIFTPVVLGCYSLWKTARAYFKRQAEQYDSWRIDEEAERLLYGLEDEISTSDEVIDDEKNESAGEEETGIGGEEVEKPLPPIPDKSLDIPGSPGDL